MKNLFVIGLIFLSIIANAQTTSRVIPRPMDTWVISDIGNVRQGVLYSVNDTGIVLLSRYMNNTTIYSYKNIDRIQLRRKNSILRGALIGAGFGIVTGIVTANEIKGESNSAEAEGFGVLIGTMVGLGSGVVFSGIGALAGMPKITIPIHGSNDNYMPILSRLNAMSLNSDVRISTQMPRYEHQSFIGYMAGPSFKIGGFDQIVYNGKTYALKQGYLSDWLNIGFMMREPWGIAATFFANQFDTSDKDFWFLMQGIAVGPLYSVSLGNKFKFDLKPQLAFVGTSLVKGEYSVTENSGIGIKPAAGLRYNVARRLSLLVDISMLSTGITLPDTDLRSASTFNLNFGLAYRYR